MCTDEPPAAFCLHGWRLRHNEVSLSSEEHIESTLQVECHLCCRLQLVTTDFIKTNERTLNNGAFETEKSSIILQRSQTWTKILGEKKKRDG
ncbi:hypothetical protein JOB18_026413 [Solea senegalensis]|uniref:Uncharacterized protein n=1 Tax=Solea senegalensis TaxID=28829 RepID=A0AAV6PE64_SOLSE|nr:hypothetical protein JOB18_026413 [Solea senegalensis]